MYVSLSRSDHVTGVELAPNVLLRLDTGKATNEAPRALGLTLISYSKLRDKLDGQPLTISVDDLRNLPGDIWQAVVSVVTSPPLSDILGVAFTISLPISSLPQIDVSASR